MTATQATADAGQPTEVVAKGATALADTIETMVTAQKTLNEKVESISKSVDELKKPQNPHGQPNGGVQRFNIRKGEDALSSRPYSLVRLAKALTVGSGMFGAVDQNWRDYAKLELNLSERLRKSYYGSAAWQGFGAGYCVPLGSDLMPTEDREVEMTDGTKVVMKGLDTDLRDECRQVMMIGGVDPMEVAHIFKSIGMGHVAKDLSANTATSGGTLVGFASQGELIEMLRANELFSQVGAIEVDLPPQGKLRHPRITSSVTIAATSEGATISESTPGTGALELSAKPYTGLTDIPDELLRFSTSVAVEAWLRQEFVREIGLKADRDMINGPGGINIQGVVNYSGIRTVIATTVGGSGDTLGPDDPLRLFADLADQNAPVDKGFFYATTNTLKAGLMTRKASSSGEYMFAIATNQYGGPVLRDTLNGYPLIGSTQIPTNRVKSATNLTLLLGGVGREWVIARAGVVEVAMTNSDSTKFQQRILTMRGTQYLDAGPRHENSFGLIDTLVNS